MQPEQAEIMTMASAARMFRRLNADMCFLMFFSIRPALKSCAIIASVPRGAIWP
jgi:hypothetical protein